MIKRCGCDCDIPIDNRKITKYDPILIQAVVDARSEFEKYLLKNGIRDSIIIKIHSFSVSTYKGIVLYRSLSQFKGSAIMWVTPRLIRNNLANTGVEREINAVYTASDAICDALLHEYGYVMYEWATNRDPVMVNMIIEKYTSPEHFAESMVGILKGEGFIRSNDDILERFVNGAFGGE